MNDVFFDHATIDAWIAEDAPLLDLVASSLHHAPPADVGVRIEPVDYTGAPFLSNEDCAHGGQ